MPMKLEAWPGGRWFRDLGGDQTVVAAGEQAAVYVNAGAVYFGAGFGWWGTRSLRFVPLVGISWATGLSLHRDRMATTRSM
jgi:hypothetical protein